MSKTVYYYKLYCETDSKWEYVWSETPPTQCPTNTAHTIDADSAVNEKKVATNETRIIADGEDQTGGPLCLFEKRLVRGLAPGKSK